MSQPETSLEEIDLEVDKPQEILEENNQAEVNFEEANSKINERRRIEELEQTEDNCHTTQTNTSVDSKSFESYCSWEF